MDLQSRVNELEHEIAELKTLVAALVDRDRPDSAAHGLAAASAGRCTDAGDAGDAQVSISEELTGASSRRTFFRAAALGTAGVVAGTVALASPAAAADTDAVLLGGAGDAQNVSSTPTRIKYGGGGLLDRNAVTVTDSDVVTSSQPSALAGYATTNSVKNGVYGFTTNSDGYGVVAINGNGGAGSGLWARSLGGVAARLEGVKANALLVPGATVGPVGGPHERGELVNDSAGELWLCVTSGTPGTWRKLGGPSTAGSFHLLAAPARAYDSRLPAPGSKIAANTVRTVSLNPVAGIPAGATGALFNLSLTETVGAGYLTVFSAALTTTPGIASVNWFATNQILSNMQVSAIDASARIKVFAGENTTHFIVDVLGYYL